MFLLGMFTGVFSVAVFLAVWVWVDDSGTRQLRRRRAAVRP